MVLGRVKDNDGQQKRVKEVVHGMVEEIDKIV